MCGIAGFINFSGNSDIDTLVTMTDTLRHRGPDGSGYKLWKSTHGVVGFGHRRLAILDLDDRAAQPMIRGNLSITYNGELYNFRELKKELLTHHFEKLKQENFQSLFQTDSDTEVVLAAFSVWGPACVHRFRGMFAFAIQDQEKQEVYLFRDRLGIKPLFLYEKAGVFLFASELKAFHANPDFEKQVDTNALRLYFQYGYVPSPKSIFRGTRKLAPGTYLKIDLKSKKQTEITYWSASKIAAANQAKPVDKKELADRTEELLKENFALRTIADVPVGVFLSGGYDSSLVAAMLQRERSDRIKTFTIGFENEKYNEAQHARKVAEFLGTDHHEYTCTKKEAQAIIPELVNFYDEPFADSSAIPTFLVSKMTAQSVKVALSADGGDELFAGYRAHLRYLRIQQKLEKLPDFSKKIAALIPRIPAHFYADKNMESSSWWSKLSVMLRDPDILVIMDQYIRSASSRTAQRLVIGNEKVSVNPQDVLQESLAGVEDRFNAMLSFDYQSTLTNDMLVKVDRATMANGLEGRDPMLDHTLYEYLISIPAEQKMAGGKLKGLLKNITHKYLPPELMERPKMGFGVPVTDWLKNDLKELVSENLRPENFRKYGLLDDRVAAKLVLELQGSNAGPNQQLWQFLQFQLWCEKWL